MSWTPLGTAIPEHACRLPIVSTLGGPWFGLPVVYTGLHGTGAIAVPPALKEFGFRNVHEVASQAIPDGDFPTVASPNPEGSCLAEAVALAKEVGALGHGDRPGFGPCGVGRTDGKGDFVLLNGNETAALLTDHVLSKWQESGKLDALRLWPRQSSPPTSLSISLNIMGSKSRKPDGIQIHCRGHPKGRGYAAIRRGGEESYGYLVGDQVRDKDAVQELLLLAELAMNWPKKESACSIDWPHFTVVTVPTKKVLSLW